MLNQIAVFIDGENINSQNFDWIIEQIQTLGTITIKRIYGDFTKASLSSWLDVIAKYAIEQKQPTSKNSSNIAMTIDVMDLLHLSQCDGLCLISSDSNLMDLALRIKQTNIPVYGFGEAKTTQDFRQVFLQFFELPNNKEAINHQTQNKSAHIQPLTSQQLRCDTKLLNALRQVINESPHTDNQGWLNFATFANDFQQQYPTLKPENYGYHKLYQLIDVIGLFEAKRKNNVIFIKNKINTKANSKQPTAEKPKPVKHQPLLDDIAQIINDVIFRTDEWVNVGILRDKLKEKGYIPTDFGFKTLTLLLRNTQGVKNKMENNTEYFSLIDDSRLNPAIDFAQTDLYKILLDNQSKIMQTFNQMSSDDQPINTAEFCALLTQNIPSQYLLQGERNHHCFLFFVKHVLNEFRVAKTDDGSFLVKKDYYRSLTA